MDTPTRISYRYDTVQLVDNEKTGSHKGYTRVIDDIDISNTGRYTYTYHDEESGKPNMLIGQIDEKYFWQLNEAVEDGLFEPAFVKSLQNRFVDEQSVEADRMIIQKFYEDDSKSQSAVFAYDERRYLDDVPQPVLILNILVNKCLDEIKKLASQTAET